MAKQIPHGDEHLICPLHQKSMDQVCHKCPWWFSVRGRNPNTDEDVDEWKCAIALTPLLLVENAFRMNQMGASMESMRNESAKAHQDHIAMAAVAVHKATEVIKSELKTVTSELPDYRPPMLLGRPTDVSDAS